MVLVRLGTRFPISEEIIGPWDTLLKFLAEQNAPASMMAAVQTAKQQVVTLRNTLTSIQDEQLALGARVAALETGVVVPSSSTGYVPFAQIPTGTKNGVNNAFSLAVTPAALYLSFNGQLLTPGGNDYTLSGSTIFYVPGKIPDATDSHYAFGWSLS